VTLEPLRRAVLEQARADIEGIRREAATRAAGIVADAERDGAALLHRAKADAIAVADMRAARELATARKAGRRLILQAKRDLHDELRTRVREAALALRADPAYPAMLEALGTIAHARLGEGAALEIDPPGAGGVRAVASSRSVDYSLVALADRCVLQLGARIEDLWT